MRNLSLAFRRKSGGINITDAAVEIPFQVIYLHMIQDFAHLVKNIITDIFSGEIKHKLISSSHRAASRHMKHPVRMFSVKAAVLGNSFRLIPDTEFHSHFMDLVGKLRQRTAQLFLIYMPVSQSAAVCVSFSEPAVVHDKKLDSKVGGFFRHIKKLFTGKVKISAFPVVHKDGSSGMLEPSSAKIAADRPVINMRHFFNSRVTVYHGGFGSPEAFSRLQLIGEILRMDSHYHSCLVKLVHFRFRQEISAVKERKSVTLSLCLGGPCICQYHERIILMAGSSSEASHSLAAVMYRSSGKLPFHFMFSIESYPVIRAV